MTDAEELDLERLPAAFGTRVVELAPGDVLPYDAANWLGAIVFVTAGEIELECRSGERSCFHEGDILWLAPFPARFVRNAASVPARLLAIWRHPCR